MIEEKGENHLKVQLFHGLRLYICNVLYYMYDKPDSQYSKLVIATRKAKTETPGSDVSEARGKSAVVEIETQSKVASSEPPYEAIMQRITYLKSTISNQNANKMKKMVQDIIMGMENILVLETKDQRRIERI